MEEELDLVLRTLDCEVKNVAISYLNDERTDILRRNNVSTIGIGLDACTEEIYQKHKPRLSWSRAIESLKNESFDRVCHIILGLGECDEDFLGLVEKLTSLGVTTALLAYTPVRNKKPVGKIELNRYRTLQLASFLIERGVISLRAL